MAISFRQLPNIDYVETFSPIIKSTTLHIALSLAISRDWTLCQLDVRNAFLHRFLHEDVYMDQPLALLTLHVLIISATFTNLPIVSSRLFVLSSTRFVLSSCPLD